jgi:endo-1,4-beta-xylanase
MKYLKLSIVVLLSIALSCSSDNDNDVEPPISVSFEVLVSKENTFRVIANNTSTGTDGLNSYWQFTENGEKVPDGPGAETHLYSSSGKYLVILTVEAPGGDVKESMTITITGEDYVPPALKDATNTFSVGMAVRSNRLTGKHNEILMRDFNNLTAEYEMKMDQIYKTEGSLDFTASDAIVDYGIANNMNIHGHTLIWHNTIPGWMNSFSGTNEEFEAMIKDYITTVVTRYKGKVRSWDVVNEAVEDGSNSLRNSIFKLKMGDDYVAKCFQFARDADPDALLFYNDYNIVFDAGKRAAILNLVDDLKSKNLIDGVGPQMHISIDSPSKSQIQTTVNEIIGKGLKIHFSELDVRVNPNNDITMLTEEREVAQQNKVKELVEIYNAIPDENKFAITIWGMRDSESWLPDFWGNPEWGLFYNDDFTAKKAHLGFLQALE